MAPRPIIVINTSHQWTGLVCPRHDFDLAHAAAVALGFQQCVYHTRLSLIFTSYFHKAALRTNRCSFFVHCSNLSYTPVRFWAGGADARNCISTASPQIEPKPLEQKTGPGGPVFCVGFFLSFTQQPSRRHKRE